MGMSKEQRKTLLEKYPCPSNGVFLSAPKVNPEIIAAVSPFTVKQDGSHMIIQNQVAGGITILGNALTYVLSRDNPEGGEALEPRRLITWLSDAGRLLSDLHHFLSVTRRGFFTTGLNKTVKNLADRAVIDTYLFGETFGEQLRAAKAIEKTGRELKEDDKCKSASKFSNKTFPSRGKFRPLNSKRPSYQSPVVAKNTADPQELVEINSGKHSIVNVPRLKRSP